MKVLKYGYENDNLPREQVTCTGEGFDKESIPLKPCNALLEITPHDVFRGVHIDYTGGKDFYYYFQCPICRNKTEVLPSLFSSNFRRMLL